MNKIAIMDDLIAPLQDIMEGQIVSRLYLSLSIILLNYGFAADRVLDVLANLASLSRIGLPWSATCGDPLYSTPRYFRCKSDVFL